MFNTRKFRADVLYYSNLKIIIFWWFCFDKNFQFRTKKYNHWLLLCNVPYYCKTFFSNKNPIQSNFRKPLGWESEIKSEFQNFRIKVEDRERSYLMPGLFLYFRTRIDCCNCRNIEHTSIMHWVRWKTTWLQWMDNTTSKAERRREQNKMLKNTEKLKLGWFSMAEMKFVYVLWFLWDASLGLFILWTNEYRHTIDADVLCVMSKNGTRGTLKVDEHHANFTIYDTMWKVRNWKEKFFVWKMMMKSWKTLTCGFFTTKYISEWEMRVEATENHETPIIRHWTFELYVFQDWNFGNFIQKFYTKITTTTSGECED